MIDNHTSTHPREVDSIPPPVNAEPIPAAPLSHPLFSRAGSSPPNLLPRQRPSRRPYRSRVEIRSTPNSTVTASAHPELQAQQPAMTFMEPGGGVDRRFVGDRYVNRDHIDYRGRRIRRVSRQ